MDMQFSTWFEAISMHDARRARKGMQKSWKKTKVKPHAKGRLFRKYEPGTFGIEIEFRVHHDEVMSDSQLQEIRENLLQKLEEELDGQRRRMTHYGYRSQTSIVDDYYKYLEDNDLYGPSYSDIDEWENDNEEPEKPDPDDYDLPDGEEDYQADLEEYESEYAQWKEERDDIEEQIEKWEDPNTQQKHKNDFVEEIIDSENWHEYDVYSDGSLPDYDTKEEEYTEILEDLGWEVTDHAHPTKWFIHPDENGVLELTSPILTVRDIGRLIELFGHAEHEETDGGTSCHIHVGLPEDTDGFDLVALTTLADEEHIQRDLPDRQFDRWAKFNDEIHNQLVYDLDDGVYNKEQFQDKIRSIERRQGTNISSFSKHNTVEFRYLSSDVLDQPDLILSWIHYFLTLPKIARGRKQIRIGRNREVYLTRMPGGAVRVDKSPERRVPQGAGSPEDLRRAREKTPFEQQKLELEKGMVRRYVDKMSLYHLQMQLPRHLMYPFKSLLTTVLKDHPKVKPFLQDDPHLNDNENFINVSQYFTVGELWPYFEKMDGFEYARIDSPMRKIYDAAHKQFSSLRKNTEYWKSLRQ